MIWEKNINDEWKDTWKIILETFPSQTIRYFAQNNVLNPTTMFSWRQEQVKYSIRKILQEVFPTVLLPIIIDYSIRNWDTFEKGDFIQVQDAWGAWWTSIILEIEKEKEKICIHYLTWPEDQIQWISFLDYKTKCRSLNSYSFQVLRCFF